MGLIRIRITIIVLILIMNSMLVEPVCSQLLQQKNRPLDSDPFGQQPGISYSQEHSEWLNKAKEAIDSEDYETAIEIIHRRLLFTKRNNNRNSRFISDDLFLDPRMKKSLKRSVNELLRNLPEKGQRYYSAQYDQVASGLYEVATKNQNYQEIGNVVRTYFNTPAGFEACLQMANYHFDHARWVAASLLYQDLKEHRLTKMKWEPVISIRLAVCYWQLSMESRLQSELLNLKKQVQKDFLVLSHNKISLVDTGLDKFSKEMGLQKTSSNELIRNWPMHLGNPGRNASVQNAIPVGKPLWNFNTLKDTEFYPSELLAEIYNDTISNFDSVQREQYFRTSTMLPLVVDGKVIIRTFSNIRALSLKDGSILWETSKISPAYQKVLKSIELAPAKKTHPKNKLVLTPKSNAISVRDIGKKQINWRIAGINSLGYQSWNDHSFGRLSSDSRNVYAVENTPTMYVVQPELRRRNYNSRSGDSENILRAYDISNGELKWEVGGARIGNWAPEQPDLLFMGPPLPLFGSLYCIVKSRGEVQLIVLDPKNGERIWTQRLEFSRNNPIYFSTDEFPAGISPVYGNGVLICETTEGTVIAIDPVQRTLLWGEKYLKGYRAGAINHQRRNGGLDQRTGASESEWTDCTPVIYDDVVLLTPQGSNIIYCLNMVDGSVRWKKLRPKGLFVATVYQEKVVLVEKNHVTAFNLEDGTPAWKEPLKITPIAGRGCRMNDLYLLSQSSGEIIAIDLDKGEIRARSYEKPSEFYGNLVASNGQLISQFLNQVSSFNSIPEIMHLVKKNLETNPADPESLAMRGEIRLYQNRKDDGLADLKKSWLIKNEPSVQNIIMRLMLDEVEEKYDHYAKSEENWKPFLKTDEDKLVFLEKLADASFRKQDYNSAANYWMDVVQHALNIPEQDEKINLHHQINRDLWIGFNLKKTYRFTDPNLKTRFDEKILNLAEEYVTKKDRHLLYRFLKIFGFQDSTIPVQEGLLDLARDEVPDAKIKSILKQLAESTNSSIAANAVYLLLQTSLQDKDPGTIKKYLNMIASRWPTVKMNGEQNGQQVIDQIRNDGSVQQLFNKNEMSNNHLQVSTHGKVGSQKKEYQITSIGIESEKYENWIFKLNWTKSSIIAFNNRGEFQWVFPIEKLATIGKPRPNPRTFGNFVMSKDNFLVFVFGVYAFVLDASAENTEPELLWEMDLVHFSERQKKTGGYHGVNLNFNPMGQIYYTSHDKFGNVEKDKVSSAFGVMTDRSITYYNREYLICRDLYTGEDIWRHKIGYGDMTLFGNQNEIYLLQKSGSSYLLHRYDANNGAHIHSGELKDNNLRIIRLYNNQFLSVKNSKEKDAQIIIQLYDPLEDKITWKRKYSNASVSLGNNRLAIFPVGQDEFSVIQNDGTIHVISLSDGKLNLDVKIDKGSDSKTLYMVTRNKTQYLLFPRNFAGRVRTSIMTKDLISISGMIYAYDRTTKKKLWQYEVKNQYTPYKPPADYQMLLILNRIEKFNKRKINRNNIINRPTQKFVHTGNITLLDRRTGLPIFESQITGNFYYDFHLRKEREKKQFWVYAFDQLLELNLSEIPLDKNKPAVMDAPLADDVPLVILPEKDAKPVEPKKSVKTGN